MFSGIWQDIRFGARLLWKDKSFLVISLCTLSLCIGANTATFSGIRSILFETTPYPQEKSVVYIGSRAKQGGDQVLGMSAVNYTDLRKLSTVYEDVGIAQATNATLERPSGSERIRSMTVSASLFTVLQVQPLLGRTFTEQEMKEKARVVVVSYGFWKKSLGGGSVGTSIRLNGAAHTVIGVMPADFYVIDNTVQMWLPVSFRPDDVAESFKNRIALDYHMLGRLKPGFTAAESRQELEQIFFGWLERFPAYKRYWEENDYSMTALPISEFLISHRVKHLETILYLLQGAVGFVLLIGCLNVASLMLSRANARMKELGVRHAMGAGYGRLARQILTESLLIAFLAGIAGSSFGFAGVKLMQSTSILPFGGQFRLSGSVLAFTFGLSVLTGIIFAAIPIFHISRVDLNSVLRDSSQTASTSRRGAALQNALILAEVALAFVLLIGAGLMVRSFQNLLQVDPGFEKEHVLTAELVYPKTRYPRNVDVRQLMKNVKNELRDIPGLETVGISSRVPFSLDIERTFYFVDGYVSSPGESAPVARIYNVDAGYFKAMKIPLLKGRFFEDNGELEARPVMIVDRKIADRYFKNRDPIGKRISIELTRWKAIVGVVDNVLDTSLSDAEENGAIYLCNQKDTVTTIYLAIKAMGDPQQAFEAVRRAIAKLDPELSLYDMSTMQDRIERAMFSYRAPMMLLACLGGVALFLAGIGIYSVISYSVSRRTKEIAIRMIFGALSEKIMSMILAKGAILGTGGLAAGVVGAAFLSRFMSSLLFGIKPVDLGVYVSVVILIALIVLVACVAPAVRATRIEASEALRCE